MERVGAAGAKRSPLPRLIGGGIDFFEKLGKDVPLDPSEVKAYKSGVAALRCKVHPRHDAHRDEQAG